MVEFFNGFYHGKGKYTYANHKEFYIYEGIWINNKNNEVYNIKKTKLSIEVDKIDN